MVVLALIWALVLLPGALRSRQSSPAASVGTFRRAMGVLAGHDHDRQRGQRHGHRGAVASGKGRVLYVPDDAGRIVGDLTHRRNAIIAGRRTRFTRLVIATVVLLPVAIIVGGLTWLALTGSAAALVTYVVLLLRWKAQSQRAAEIMRLLPDDPEQARRGVPDRGRMAAGAGRSMAGLRVAVDPDAPWERTGSG